MSGAPDPLRGRVAYDAIAGAWDAARRSLTPHERTYLTTLLADAPRGASVLDLGCGTGRPIAEHLMRLGHRVVGVDASPALLAVARTRLPSATWIHARIEDYEPRERFDAVVCWDALFHVERAHHAPIIAMIGRCLTPHGRLMLSSGGSATAPFTDTMFGHEFFYDSHPPGVLIALVERSGFEIVTAELVDLPTGDRDRGRLAVVARRTAPERPRGSVVG